MMPAIPSPFTERIESVHEIAELMHAIGRWMLIVLISLHVLAVLKHAFVDRDGVMRRMLADESPSARGRLPKRATVLVQPGAARLEARKTARFTCAQQRREWFISRVRRLHAQRGNRARRTAPG